MRTTTRFKSNGTDVQAEVFHPSGTPNGGVIVLAYGSDGLVNNQNGPWKTMIEEHADKLAGHGFISVIADYIDSTGTTSGQLDLADLEEYIRQVAKHRATWERAIVDTVAHVTQPTKFPGVDRTRVGLIGYSLGGHLCARIANAAKALVVFFAPYMDGLSLSGPLTLKAEIHHGEKDLLPYALNAVKIDRELKANGASSNLLPRYPGAVHGFVGTDTENTSARSRSFASTLSFFAKQL